MWKITVSVHVISLLFFKLFGAEFHATRRSNPLQGQQQLSGWLKVTGGSGLMNHTDGIAG